MNWRVPVAMLAMLTLGACGDDSSGGAATAGGDGETADADTGGADASESGGDDDGDACGGCDDSDPCTEDICNEDGTCTFEPLLNNECRPRIEVDYPARAATILIDPGVDTLTVTGTVQSGLGAITSLTLNDEAVTVNPDGSFSHEIAPTYGGNTLVFATEDDAGNTRARVQSFLFSSEYRLPTTAKEGMAPLGLGIYLDQEALDDLDPNDGNDDLATIVKLAVANLDLSTLFDANAPIATEAGYKIYLTDLNAGSTSANLDAIDGGIRLYTSLNDIIGTLFFDCTEFGCELSGGDSTGGLTIDFVSVQADLNISANDSGGLDVEVSNVSTNISNLNLFSNNIWTNFLLSIIEPFIIGGVVADLESLLNNSVADLLGPLLADGFAALAIQTSLDLPNLGDPEASITVDLVTDFAATDFHDGVTPPSPTPPRGGAFIERGGGYTATLVTPYENLGIPDRAGCGLAPQSMDLTRSATLEIGLADDLLNQILFAGWRGGLLEFPVGPELLGDVDFTLLGITDLNLALSGMLAPTASDCNDQGQLLAHLGDLRIDGSMQLQGKPLTFVAYVSCELVLEVGASETGIALDVTGVDTIDSELTINEPEQIEAETLLKSVLQNALVDALVGALQGGGLGSIPLPEIDLSGPLGLPAGTALIQISPESVTRVNGTTIVGGTF